MVEIESVLMLDRLNPGKLFSINVEGRKPIIGVDADKRPHTAGPIDATRCLLGAMSGKVVHSDEMKRNPDGKSSGFDTIDTFKSSK